MLNTNETDSFAEVAKSIHSAPLDVRLIEILRPLTSDFSLKSLLATTSGKDRQSPRDRAIRVIATHKTLQIAREPNLSAVIEWLPPVATTILDIEQTFARCTQLAEEWQDPHATLDKSLKQVITGNANKDGQDWVNEGEMRDFIQSITQNGKKVNLLGDIVATMVGLANGISIKRFWQKEGLEPQNGELNVSFNNNLSRLIRLFAWISYLDEQNVNLNTDKGVASWEKIVSQIKMLILPLIEDQPLQQSLREELDLMVSDILVEVDEQPQAAPQFISTEDINRRFPPKKQYFLTDKY